LGKRGDRARERPPHTCSHDDHDAPYAVNTVFLAPSVVF
jgi:hypothetical protein